MKSICFFQSRLAGVTLFSISGYLFRSTSFRLMHLNKQDFTFPRVFKTSLLEALQYFSVLYFHHFDSALVNDKSWKSKSNPQNSNNYGLLRQINGIDFRKLKTLTFEKCKLELIRNCYWQLAYISQLHFTKHVPFLAFGKVVTTLAGLSSEASKCSILWQWSYSTVEKEGCACF